MSDSICIVTPDLLGFVRNGGIGTSCYYIASEFSRNGYNVTCFLSQFNSSIDSEWKNKYKEDGINIVVAESYKNFPEISSFPNHSNLIMADLVYRFLINNNFDLVLFMDWHANGFYALHAKRSGLHFQSTQFLVQVHSPSLWHTLNNAELVNDPQQMLTWYMERKCVEMADVVISPSRYMIKWTQDHGFCLPKKTYVLPNLIDNKNYSKKIKNKLIKIKEFVFFGRLEYRKGLVQFCDALDRLNDLGTIPEKVCFLGKFSTISHKHSVIYIAERSKRWNFPIEIQSRLDQQEALLYLSNSQRLAVIPSISDNSPYSVYECLVFGIPFIARDVGGVAELIATSYHQKLLFDDNPRSLTALFLNSLRSGVYTGNLAFDLDSNRSKWKTLFSEIIKENKSLLSANLHKNSKKDVKNKTFVSVCLIHYNRPSLLKQAISSLKAQDYKNFEVILVDDGSTDSSVSKMLKTIETDFNVRGWKLLRLENGYLGRARNIAASHAIGDYLLFMDDDNVAKPHMISTFVQAAEAMSADLITSKFDVFSGENKPNKKTKIIEHYLPVGNIISFSTISNVIGDANSLFRRDYFLQQKGFTEDYGVGHEDFELNLKLVLSGAKVGVIPESLFWYRRNNSSMLSSTNSTANTIRSLRPFFEKFPADLAEMALTLNSLVFTSINPTFPIDNLYNSLSNYDDTLASSGDPDSLSSLIPLTRILIKNGSYEVAKQLLCQLESSGTQEQQQEVKFIYLILNCIEYAANGNYGHMRSIINKINYFLPSKTELIIIYFEILKVLEKRNDSLKQISFIVNRINNIKIKTIPIHLELAFYFTLLGKHTDLFRHLREALKMSDADYLSIRPDVAKSVISCNFKSGIEHYILHGKNEGMTWPSSALFKIAIDRISLHISSDSNSNISIMNNEIFNFLLIFFSKDE